MKRWIDEAAAPPADRAAELLRRLPDPAPLTPGQLARIEAHITTPRVVSPRWWRLALGTLTLAGAAGLTVALHEPYTGERLREVSVPRCGTARLAGDGALQIALTGPGTAAMDGRGRGPVRLREGVLAVRAGEAPVVIETLRARVTVRPGATAEVAVRQSRVTVAAYGAAALAPAMVEWFEAGQRVEVPAGTAVEPQGRVAATELREVERVLEGGAAAGCELTPR